MNTNWMVKKSLSTSARKLFQGFFALLFALSLVGIQPPQQVQAAAYTWIAYNDSVSGSSQHTTANTTTIAYNGSGQLRRQSDGSNTGITAAFTSNGSISSTSNGVDANSGTDAYNTFYPYADMVGVVNSSTSGWWVDLTLSGLDPARTYTFAGSTARDGGYTTRNTTFILSGDTAAINASTSGVTVVDDHTIAINTGTNRAQGYVVRWTGINPGSDGTIVIRSRASTTSEIAGSVANAYALSVFMLAEETTDPVITVAGALNAFTSQPGVYSTVQTYTVSGGNLTEDISIDAPAGFELSTNGTDYFAHLSLPRIAGDVAPTTISVRLYSGTIGLFQGNITHASSGVITNMPVSGTVTTCGSDSMVAVEDTYLSANDPTYNNGGNTSLHINGTTGTDRRTALLRWDLSSIPSNAVVTSGSLGVYVSDTSTVAYSLYSMRQSWVEGTSTQAASTTSANWNTYNGAGSWGTAGAASTSLDRFDTNLWNATTTSFSTTGSKTVILNAAGVSAVQEWISGAAGNYGLIIQDYTGSSNSLYIASSENTTEVNRPRLNLEYCAGSETYAVNATSSGHGSVTISPLAASYPSGVTVTLTPVADLGYEFGSWSGPDAADVLNNGNGTWSLFVDGDKTVFADFVISSVNVAPYAPVLMQPADDAVNVSVPPTLQVTASDPNPLDTLNVSFYGREVSTTAGPDFRLVAIPDTQNYATSYPDVFTDHLQWIADSREPMNIVFATSVGDMVNTATSATEYTRADTAYDRLDAGNVNYSVGPGNHDTTSGSLWPTYFGVSRFSGKSTYGGAYNDYNTYHLFSASGMDFLLINLQYNPTSAILDWADARLKEYPDRRAIVEQHDILNTDDSWNNQASYNALRDNPNLFLMLCGHMHSTSDGAAYRAETGTDGHTIHIVMQDYQDEAGSGYLRIYRFSPADDMIYMTTYSPITGESLTTSPDQMNLSYDMGGNMTPYGLIGTVPNVVNGSNASVPWPGLAPNTEYEWYAAVSDGASTTNGPTWSFTSGTGSGNTPPVISGEDPRAVTMSEDGTPTAFNLTLNATDIDLGDTLTWSVATPAGYGTALASGTGPSTVVSYTPTANYYGADGFVVQVADGNGGADTVTVNVTVEAVNDLPVADPQNVSVFIDTARGITLTGSDIDSSTLNYMLVSNPTNGSLTGTAPGLTYTPASDYTGPDSFTFLINDGVGDSNTATVNIQVSSGNPPQMPSSFYGEIHISDQQPIVGDLVEVYVPGVVTPVASTAITTDAGQLVYTLSVPGEDGVDPKEGGVEGDVVTFRIGTRVVSSGVWHTGTNVQVNIHPPEAIPGGPYDGSAGVAVGLSGAANDWGADVSTYEWDWDNDGTFDATGQTPSHTWASNGAYTVSLRVTDLNGGQGTALTTVNVVNHAPTDIDLSASTVAENRVANTLVGTLTSTDPDPGNTFSYALVSGAGSDDNASFNIDGNNLRTSAVFDYETKSSYAVRIRTMDQGDLNYEESFVITVSDVNEAPVVADIANQTIAEGAAFAAISLDDFVSDVDNADAQMTWTFSGNVDLAVSITNRVATITAPNSDWSGAETITFRAADPGGLYDEDAATFTVTAANDAPVVMDIPNQTIVEGGAFATISLDNFVSDVDNTDAQMTWTSSGNTNLSVSITNRVATILVLDAEWNGSEIITFRAADPDGLFDEDTAIFTVTGVNDAPVVSNIPDQSILEGATFFTIPLDDYVVDVDNPDTQMVWSYSGDVDLAVSITDRVATITPPNSAWSGVETITFRATDPDGLFDEDVATFSITSTVVTHDYPLVVGWNLVSFDLHPTSTAIADVLASISGQYDLVYGWNATSGSWMKYAPGVGYGDTLTTLDETRGFWIKMNAADTLSVSGTVVSPTSIALESGWNLVGFPAGASLVLPDAFTLHGVDTELDLVYAYRANEPSDPWKLFDPEAPDWVNDLNEMAPGWGYWVFVSADCTWNVVH